MQKEEGKREKSKPQGKTHKCHPWQRGNTFGFWVVVLPFAFFLLPGFSHACPGCKEALFDPGQLVQKLSAAKGYALSIGLLLAVPCLLAAAIGLAVTRSIRKHRSRPIGDSH